MPSSIFASLVDIAALCKAAFFEEKATRRPGFYKEQKRKCCRVFENHSSRFERELKPEQN